MQNINKGNPPDFFLEFVRKTKLKEWNDVAPVREQLREYILQEEQKGCCVYTERQQELSYRPLPHPKSVS